MEKSIHDMIIIGGGPAGLTAGIYAARASMDVILIESTFSPSLITITDWVENYPGFPEGIGGFDIVEKFRQQAVNCGLKSAFGDVSGIVRESVDGYPVWKVIADEDYFAHAVIFATGANHAKLGCPGEVEFTGKGVSYCATCDGPFYRDREVVVVGGGDTAVQEAIFLTKFASKVTLVHRRDSLRATAVLRERAMANEKIVFELDSIVESVYGDKLVEGIVLKNKKTGTNKNLRTDGVFIFTGLIPNTQLLKGIAELDANGYIIVDGDMRTTAPGIFSCGDCNKKLLRQVVTACGDGATAAFSAQHYVEDIHGTAYEGRKK
ncbi:MAG TPA: thioredoxin-disulfide reductase [Desulfomonilia bacterium]